MLPRRLALPLALSAVLACRGGDRGAAPTPAPAAMDWARPASALALSADEAARRAGSFSFEAEVEWKVSRGVGSRTVNASERHRVRQLAEGEFEAESEIDPGGGPGTETGRTVVYAGGATYARSRFAPFRVRPGDRGEEARRARDESFRLAGDLAALYGPALRLDPAGEATVLGRRARRFTLALDRSQAPAPPPAPPGRRDDPDTRARLDLLEGRVPLEAEGELFADDATGLPLRVRLVGAFGTTADAGLRAEVRLDARVVALGRQVAAVRAPQGALPDERKPNGPARALEAAGLRERGKPSTGERAEPEDAPPE